MYKWPEENSYKLRVGGLMEIGRCGSAGNLEERDDLIRK